MADQDGHGELRGTLARVLLPELDALTARVVADIHAHSPAYASGRPVSTADLTSICRDNLLRALEDFGGLPPTCGDFGQAARETGRRRAEQGVPLETVLQAYRRGGRVMWQAMTEWLRTARAAGPATPPDQDTALEMAGAVWETIDHYSSLMAEAYRLTQLEMRRSQDTRRGALFEALLDGRGGQPGVVEAAAAALGVPVRDRYLVVVTGQDPTAPPNPAPQLSAVGLWSFWRPRGDRLAGVVRIGGADPGEVPEALAAGAGLTAGISQPFAELAQAHRAVRQAESALRTLTPGSGLAAFLDERLVEALACDRPEIAGHIVERYLGAVLRAGSERGPLLQTLGAWLDVGCSAPRTADALYCHRNTVLNRIARVAELTGLPSDDGDTRLGWALALRALPVLPAAAED
ncbi:PucR family transcriptional regulator [Streptomyces griseoviridis]|uniref:PucR family transcriptional regulator n=1 Tax=Streptomyces griseoviridis TaxID=45398 RepID=UPI0034492FB1